MGERVAPERGRMTAPAPPGYDACRAALDAVLAIRDPEVGNLQVTCAHYELSLLLGRRLGPDAGANFHTWAVWGSREAGTTIGRRDVDGLTPRMAALGAGVGALLGFTGRRPRRALVGLGVGAALGGLATRFALRNARDRIAHGNRIVVDEIGGATARFATTFADDVEPDGDRLLDFLAWLRPGPAAEGGQDDLRRAFTAYYRAAFEPDRHRRHQLVFAANCIVVAHEHVRLQTDIATAMPPFMRRWITRTLLDFRVGREVLHVAHDLTPSQGAPYPTTLASLTEPEAISAVASLRDARRPAGTLTGSGASDWSAFAQRMNYVVELFRSRHLVADVFAEPYPGEMIAVLPKLRVSALSAQPEAQRRVRGTTAKSVAS
ncbi:MAG: hypothetical protein JWN46_3143 [Acidimicrobiales bacterium]|nr:hypothetical protein [Acidimicrobiales bacterium]